MNTAHAHAAPSAPAIAHDDAHAAHLLHDLVATPSVSGDERAAVEHFVEHLRVLGYRAHIDAAGNAVGVRHTLPPLPRRGEPHPPFPPLPSGERPGDEDAHTSTREHNTTTAALPAPHILLLGHIDTVPGDIPVRIEGDTLHGRGSVDAKGSLAAFAVAGARAELPPGARLTVIGAVGEEADSPGACCVRDHYAPPDACIIGEPSAWDRCTLGYKGRLVAEAAFTRPCAHSSGPDATAPERAVAWWESLRDDAAALNAPHTRASVFDALQVTLQRIHTTTDGLTETTTAEVGYRLPPWLTPEALEARIRNLHLPPLPSGERPGDEDDQSTTRARTNTAALPAHTGVPIHHPTTLRFRAHAPCVRADRDNPIARALFGAIADAGGRPRAVVKTGTSDMNTVGARWACPIVAYGPGDSALDHTPEERLDIPEYLRSIRILQNALEALASELAADAQAQ